MAALTVDFRKHSGPTPADDMAAQIITDCGNFTLDFKQHGFFASPFFLQTLGPWFKNEMQKWLGSPFPEDVWAWWLLMYWLQLQFTPCEALPSFWIGFAWQFSQACGISNDPLWLTLFVEGVNDRLLDHCQVSSVPHYCGFKEQEIPRMYTLWMVIYIKVQGSRFLYLSHDKLYRV